MDKRKDRAKFEKKNIVAPSQVGGTRWLVCVCVVVEVVVCVGGDIANSFLTFFTKFYSSI